MKHPSASPLPKLALHSACLASAASLLFAADSSPEKESAPLPLAEVILYSSGVGYFERSGEIQNSSQVHLRFKVDDINDLLKSMVVRDLDGGTIGAITYGSRDPVDKTLKSFGVDLTENLTLGQLLNQVRGERVQVTHLSDTEGNILSVEQKTQLLENGLKQMEVEFLNLLTPEGLQSIPLAGIRRIKLLDDRLNQELRQALSVLASSHDSQKKTVAISFEGAGKRRVSVAYIAQAPVWKTSYRLVLNDDAPPFLQGWAIVENTTDEDWNQVQLSLVSGRPISFTMDLYQPLYTTRPEVQMELYSSLRPQIYQDAVETQERQQIDFAQPPSPATGLERKKMNLGAQGGSPPMRMQPELMQRYGLRPPGPDGADGVQALAAESSARSLQIDAGIQAVAQAEKSGELFQYAIASPVTLARQNSALLPIVNEKVAGEKLSIYNENVHPKFPLNGFRLKNTTSLHLMQGPVTVFDSGAYAGDARLEDLAAGQDRLLSYALDLKTEVSPERGPGQQTLVSLRLQKGALIIAHKLTAQKTYLVRNKDDKTKTITIEHPFQSEWELVEPKTPAERTRDAYRFDLSVPAGESKVLTVREVRPLSEQIQITDLHADTIAFYLRAREVSPKIKEALQHVVRLRDRLNQTAQDRARREQRIQEITQEQSRIRENMARLNPNSELYARYVKTLDQQENELEQLRAQIESLKDTEAKQSKELNDYLLQLDLP